MTSEYLNLPGGCFVNEIKSEAVNPNLNGMFIQSQLLQAYGFEAGQTATMLFTPGRIIITVNDEQQNVFSAIEELQLRHDELRQDFEPAIKAILKAV